MSVLPSAIPGSVVTLNSGGQKMTVVELEGDVAMCMWFAGSTLKQKKFPLCVLRRSDEITRIVREIVDPKEMRSNA